MHFFPILSTLRRHRTAAILIVAEIALTCAIVCNAVFLIRDRLARMDQPSGVVEDELVLARLAGIGARADRAAVTAQDLAALRQIPGVKFAAVTNMVPFGGSSWNTSIGLVPDSVDSLSSGMYFGSADLVEALGVRIVAGRDFTSDEFRDFDDVQATRTKVPAILLSRGLAERLFPDKNPVGQAVYATGRDPVRVVGVYEHLARPNDMSTKERARWSMILPITPAFTVGGNYVLRVDPARATEVLAAVTKTLERVDPNRIFLDRQRFSEMRENYFRKDRAMAYLLVGVSLALLVVTALGVVGLASFWVQQRTRQIGVRRALGATRGDILRYFQLENFILATIGIVLGMALAYAINLWLMQKYQIPRLPASFLPIGATLLWLLGQIAVLGPALRASLIPPAIATRSV